MYFKNHCIPCFYSGDIAKYVTVPNTDWTIYPPHFSILQAVNKMRCLYANAVVQPSMQHYSCYMAWKTKVHTWCRYCHLCINAPMWREKWWLQGIFDRPSYVWWFISGNCNLVHTHFINSILSNPTLSNSHFVQRPLLPISSSSKSQFVYTRFIQSHFVHSHFVQSHFLHTHFVHSHVVQWPVSPNTFVPWCIIWVISVWYPSFFSSVVEPQDMLQIVNFFLLCYLYGVMWSSKMSQNSQILILRYSQSKQVISLLLLFLQSCNCLYLWNQLTNFNGVCCKR